MKWENKPCMHVGRKQGKCSSLTDYRLRTVSESEWVELKSEE